MAADADGGWPQGRGLRTRVIITLLLVSAFAAPWAARAEQKNTAIVGATVLHPELEGAGVVAPDNTILIEGNRIIAVGAAAHTRVPRGATVIDAHGKWVIPGLIDSHVHFFQSGDLYTRPDVVDLGALVPYAAEVQRNRARLPQTFKVYLASGVTSAADVGGPFWNFEVREAARELSRKPDYIKVWYIHRAGDDLAAQEAIVRATGDAAHAAGLRLAVHATELLVAKSALRAGADYLVHSVQDEPVDDEFIGLARARHILYCPTLFVPLGYVYALSGLWQPTEAERRLADPDVLSRLHLPEGTAIEHLPERMAKLLREHREPALPAVAMQNLLTVWNAGITVVLGTDAGNIGTVHGPSVFREMDLMQRSGLTALQVLKSATVNGALTVAVPDVGSVAPGKLADLVVLDADPLADLANLSRVSYVLRDGRVFRPAELLQSVRAAAAP